MNKIPLVSIIIPTYNDCHVVSNAIDCSLHQTYDNLEIIVVDDGSIDGTEQLLKEKYGNRIKYVAQENRGLASARNMGIRYASGKYLQFLDADDLIDQDKIRIQVKHLQDISGIALAYCDYIRSDIDDMNIEYERMNPVLQKEKPFDDLMMKWETEVSIPHHCFLFDGAIFRDYGIMFDENLPNHEDWECLMNVFSINPIIVFIDQPLANYRVRSESMRRNGVKMRQGYLKAINKQIRKNSPHKDLIKKLKIRKKQIKRFYANSSPLARIIKCLPLAKRIYKKVVT